MNLTNEINAYLEHCKYQKKLNELSIKAYSIDLKQFMVYSSNSSEEAFSKLSISRYIQNLHQKYLPRTVKRKIASLRAFLNYLEFEEILEINPIRKIRTKFQEPKQLPKTIPLCLIEKLLTTAHNEQSLVKTSYGVFVALRNKAILETLFATGVRVSELCSIKMSDINLEDGTIHIVGKGTKERIIQIGNPEAIKALRKYHEVNKSESEFFFTNRLAARFSEQSVRFMIQQLSNKAGIPKHITPHMFRHSFATLLLEEDVDIRYIQRMLGHSSIQTTQIYTQVTMKKQRQILTLKHPRNKFNLE
jgi:integrase/recombinase XerD